VPAGASVSVLDAAGNPQMLAECEAQQKDVRRRNIIEEASQWIATHRRNIIEAGNPQMLADCEAQQKEVRRRNIIEEASTQPAARRRHIIEVDEDGPPEVFQGKQEDTELFSGSALAAGCSAQDGPPVQAVVPGRVSSLLSTGIAPVRSPSRDWADITDADGDGGPEASIDDAFGRTSLSRSVLIAVEGVPGPAQAQGDLSCVVARFLAELLEDTATERPASVTVEVWAWARRTVHDVAECARLDEELRANMSSIGSGVCPRVSSYSPGLLHLLVLFAQLPPGLLRDAEGSPQAASLGLASIP
jgi:hypothetical protein